MITLEQNSKNMHIYFRMMALGFNEESASCFAELWEEMVSPVFYRA